MARIIDILNNAEQSNRIIVFAGLPLEKLQEYTTLKMKDTMSNKDKKRIEEIELNLPKKLSEPEPKENRPPSWNPQQESAESFVKRYIAEQYK
ncbi:MAG: hypothetical protein WD267_01195 [Balneolales bacterium]